MALDTVTYFLVDTRNSLNQCIVYLQSGHGWSRPSLSWSITPCPSTSLAYTSHQLSFSIQHSVGEDSPPCLFIQSSPSPSSSSSFPPDFFLLFCLLPSIPILLWELPVSPTAKVCPKCAGPLFSYRNRTVSTHCSWMVFISGEICLTFNTFLCPQREEFQTLWCSLRLLSHYRKKRVSHTEVNSKQWLKGTLFLPFLPIPPFLHPHSSPSFPALFFFFLSTVFLLSIHCKLISSPHWSHTFLRERCHSGLYWSLRFTIHLLHHFEYVSLFNQKMRKFAWND